MKITRKQLQSLIYESLYEEQAASREKEDKDSGEMLYRKRKVKYSGPKNYVEDPERIIQPDKKFTTAITVKRSSIPAAASWAKKEAGLWQGKDVHDAIGWKKPHDKNLWDRLNFYYSILGKGGKLKKPRSFPAGIAKKKAGSSSLMKDEAKYHWSAAFISSAMNAAGESGFKFHSGHQGYIGPATKLRRYYEKGKTAVPKGNWLAYKVKGGKSEVEILPGDLLCFAQPGKKISRDGLPGQNDCCHCDIYVGGGKTIGGNTGKGPGTVPVMSKMGRYFLHLSKTAQDIPKKTMARKRRRRLGETMALTEKQLRSIIRESLEESTDKNIVAIYPGRFQPMGKHHLATYDWMSKTFGPNNSYIASSDKTCPIKSPFCFDEKKKIAIAHGVPERSFVNERSPYIPKNILSQYDPESTAVVFIVGKKDMSDNPRFRVGMKKSGGPTYFQHYKPGFSLEGYGKHGHLVVAPHQDIDVGGEEMSGTKLRQFIPDSSPAEFKDAMGFDDSEVELMMRKKLEK